MVGSLSSYSALVVGGSERFAVEVGVDEPSGEIFVGVEVVVLDDFEGGSVGGSRVAYRAFSPGLRGDWCLGSLWSAWTTAKFHRNKLVECSRKQGQGA